MTFPDELPAFRMVFRSILVELKSNRESVPPEGVVKHRAGRTRNSEQAVEPGPQFSYGIKFVAAGDAVTTSATNKWR